MRKKKPVKRGRVCKPDTDQCQQEPGSPNDLPTRSRSHVKVLWALLDLITMIVLISGLYLWWKKRMVPVEQLLAETDSGREGLGAPIVRMATR